MMKPDDAAGGEEGGAIRSPDLIQGAGIALAQPETKPAGKYIEEKNRTANRLSRWLVGAFVGAIAIFVLVTAYLAIYVAMQNPDKLEATISALGKWAAMISALLAAPLGFVLGHYYKTGD